MGSGRLVGCWGLINRSRIHGMTMGWKTTRKITFPQQFIVVKTGGRTEH